MQERVDALRDEEMAALVEYIAFLICLLNIRLATYDQLLRIVNFGGNALML